MKTSRKLFLIFCCSSVQKFYLHSKCIKAIIKQNGAEIKQLRQFETHLVVNWPLPWTTGHFALFWLQASIALQHNRMRFEEASKKSWSINVKAHIWHCNYRETNEKKSSFIILYIFCVFLVCRFFCSSIFLSHSTKGRIRKRKR